MTEKFRCISCNVGFNNKCNYKKHLETAKHKRNIEASQSGDSTRELIMNLTKSMELMKAATETNLRVMRQELNEERERSSKLEKEMTHAKEQYSNLSVRLSEEKTRSSKLAERVRKLESQFGGKNVVVNGDVNGTVHVGDEIKNTINVQLVDWRSCDIGHIGLPEQFTIAKSRVAIEETIKALHFNDRAPQQRNINIPNKKLPHMRVFSAMEGGWTLIDKKNGLDMLKDEALSYICDWESEIRKRCSTAQYDKWVQMIRDAQGDSGKLDPKREKAIRRTIEMLVLNNQSK